MKYPTLATSTLLIYLAASAADRIGGRVEAGGAPISGADVTLFLAGPEALRGAKNKMYIFTSTHDRMLGTLMPLSGTANRKFDDVGAGIKGFVLPAGASAATRKLYADKIITIPFALSFSAEVFLSSENFGFKTHARFCPVLLKNSPPTHERHVHLH